MENAADPAIAAARLSPRQRECLRLVYDRKTSKEIAIALGLSPGTVHTYCAEAVATLGAQNRRHAAEILHGVEHGGGSAAPSEVELDPAGVPSSTPATPSGGHGNVAPDWRRLLPFRLPGAADNDLPIFARLLWIPVLAVLLAIGFGAIVSGLGILSDLVGRPHGR